MRVFLALFLFVTLGACATKDASAPTGAGASVGKWSIQKGTDRIGDEPGLRVWLATNATNRGASAGTAVVQLMCFGGQRIVRFAYEVRVGGTRNAILEYRFDQKPGRKAKARFMLDNRVVVIDQSAEVAQFLQDLATSQVLVVQVSSLIVGRTTAEYRTEGAPAAIEAAYAECPPAAIETAKRKKKG